MATTFPLDTATCWDRWKIEEITFDAPEQVESSQTAGGEILSAELAPMLWSGSIKLGDMTQIEAAENEMLLDLLRPAGRTAYAYDTRRPGPLNDLSGALLGAATPVIYSIGSARELRLSGLPSGYVLTRGDYLSFDYGSAPVRRALHRIVPATVIVPVTGITGPFEVTPPLRYGASAGAAVSLIKPACKVRLVPGSVSKGLTSKTITTGMSFKFIQTLG